MALDAVRRYSKRANLVFSRSPGAFSYRQLFFGSIFQKRFSDSCGQDKLCRFARVTQVADGLLHFLQSFVRVILFRRRRVHLFASLVSISDLL